MICLIALLQYKTFVRDRSFCPASPTMSSKKSGPLKFITFLYRQQHRQQTANVPENYQLWFVSRSFNLTMTCQKCKA